MASPALAGGGIFDFGLTLPIMAAQFLALMVFLDKSWFGPVGGILDERDAKLRGMLAQVKDNSAQLQALADEAEAELKAARKESQDKVAALKASTQKEADARLDAAKAGVERDLAAAVAALEAEKAEAMKGMDAQVRDMADEILRKVLPEGVTA